jgi:hypothetical protein
MPAAPPRPILRTHPQHATTLLDAIRCPRYHGPWQRHAMQQPEGNHMTTVHRPARLLLCVLIYPIILVAATGCATTPPTATHTGVETPSFQSPQPYPDQPSLSPQELPGPEERKERVKALIEQSYASPQPNPDEPQGIATGSAQ